MDKVIRSVRPVRKPQEIAIKVGSAADPVEGEWGYVKPVAGPEAEGVHDVGQCRQVVVVLIEVAVHLFGGDGRVAE